MESAAAVWNASEVGILFVVRCVGGVGGKGLEKEVVLLEEVRPG